MIPIRIDPKEAAAALKSIFFSNNILILFLNLKRSKRKKT